ncbi:MAG: RNA polymerase sigma factor [Flavobacteriales bacterium]|nr:RNA polymerase sigma factor [Flavobacteriales bacterium]
MSTLEFNQHVIGMRHQLFYFALSLTRDRDDAHDLVQESLLKAFTNRDKFQVNTNLKAWLYTIVKNSFINGHRRIKRARSFMERLEHDGQEARTTRAPQSAEASVKLAEIERGLDSLSPTFRDPFTMHHEGYKYHEISERLGIPIGTVKSRIHQARHLLKEMLTDKNVPA